jgi:hypothetical protein
LREVVCPVLKLREEKRILVKVGGGKIDFFLPMDGEMGPLRHGLIRLNDFAKKKDCITKTKLANGAVTFLSGPIPICKSQIRTSEIIIKTVPYVFLECYLY